MTDAERAFETVIARATADLPDYERAARQMLMLSCFKTGWRAAQTVQHDESTDDHVRT